MDIYLIIVIVLFILAISDLMVGVSNDAVNFLNSAIGSKVAPRHIILIVASLGILVGTSFSSGMMEVARKGIFHPNMFYLSEIMVIFLSVMITDVLLLDLFNTFGMPTSTTVSIVFELLGSAVAVSILKVAAADGGLADVVEYINTAKAMAIIFGILLSVIIAFSSGAILQFLTRIIFSFKFSKKVKYYGGLWGGAALAAITYFILVKGAKGTAFLAPETVIYIKSHTWLIVGYSFVFWAIVLQGIILFTKANILKGIVLVGTFALALAFAANDLVNFIGVPLAGFSSYLLGQEVANPDSLLMTGLAGKTPTPTMLLFIAGIVMVITLWFNKKSKSVTKTEVNLGRQSEGYERFESSGLSRAFVRISVNVVNTAKFLTPVKFQNFVNSRFEQDQENIAAIKSGEAPAFDLIRAANNLMVASILISIATSMKLPLSTTYVTFMVAMGTSLADRAWGRESAVYRVNGVLTVIGGWFFTAFSAFTASFIVAVILFFGGTIAIFGMIALAVFILFRTHIIHKKRSAEEEEDAIEITTEKKDQSTILKSVKEEIDKFVVFVPEILKNTFEGLSREDRVILKEARSKAKKLRKKSNKVTNIILSGLDEFQAEDLKMNKRFGKVITSVQAISNRINNLVSEVYEHINNNHKTLSQEQLLETSKLIKKLSENIDQIHQYIESNDFSSNDDYKLKEDEIAVMIAEFDNNQITRIKTSEESSRNSMLFLNMLSDIETASGYLGKLLNSLRKCCS